jgi:hypothetical protein
MFLECTVAVICWLKEGICGLWIDHQGVGAVRREMNVNQSQVLLKCTLLSRVHDAHNINEHDEQNILKLEFALFRLKCNVSTNNWRVKSYL